jgi:hypothetical protein
MVKRAGRPKFQLDKRNVNHKRRDSIITRIGCSGGAPSWAEAGRAAKDNSKPEQQAVWLRRLLVDPFIQSQRRTPNERSRK